MVDPSLEHKEFHLNPWEQPKKEKKGLYYLAHPYKNNPIENLISSVKINNKLIDLGYLIYNPLVSHYLNADKWRTEDFWYLYDLQILENCKGIILSPGFGNSKGCMLELEKANKLKKKNPSFEILYYEEIVK